MEYPKLPKRFKAAWLKALRSGKYVQGKECLTDTEFNKKGNLVRVHCCLGVCAAVCRTPIKKMLGGTLNKGMVPRAVLKVLNSPIEVGERECSLQNKLVSMNDSENKSFKYIASWIERYL